MTIAFMEAYYSSDEEIAWGPITLREIKGDLKRALNRKPKRRHTVVCNIQNPTVNEIAEKMNKQLDVSGTSTAYYTPNDTLKSSNSNFLEKLSYVINEPSSEGSEYVSVLEDHSENMEKQNIPTICITEAAVHETSGNQDSSCLNFVNAAENRETQYNIDNFQQSLVENTYYSPERESVRENTQESPNNFCANRKLCEEVIVLSDDEDSFVESDEGSEDCKITFFTQDIDVDNDTNRFTDIRETEDSSAIDKYVPCHDSQTEEIKNNCEIDDGESDESSIVEENHFLGENTNTLSLEENAPLLKENVHSPCIQHKLSTINELSTTSPVTLPSIDLKQFDDTYPLGGSLKLDDTLEEMDRFFEQGVDYEMPEDKNSYTTPAKNEVTSSSHKGSAFKFNPDYITPFNAVPCPKYESSSNSREKVSHIPKSTLRILSADKIQSNKNIAPSSAFKVPQTPVRSKLTFPTPPKSCPAKLKDVVSPVALYIKGSPRVPLKQNVHPKILSKTPTSKVTSSRANKENFDELPEIIHEPSKKQIVTSEKHIVIPDYMKKLNIIEGQVVKHEGRIRQHVDPSKVRKKLMENDITLNESLLDGSGDISILTSKQAFVK